MVAFQTMWPVMRGKINMIGKEWCIMDMDQISQFCDTVQVPSSADDMELN